MQSVELKPEAVASAVSKLALMAFFPGDPDTRAALIYILLELVDTKEHLDWLVERAVKLYTRWPGVAEIRALYCSRFRPKDGVTTYSEIYVGGFPHQSKPEIFDAPRGAPVSKDAAIDAQVRKAAKVKALPAVGRRK
jgi:hypothetical protein